MRDESERRASNSLSPGMHDIPTLPSNPAPINWHCPAPSQGAQKNDAQIEAEFAPPWKVDTVEEVDPPEPLFSDGMIRAIGFAHS